jgi:hypothetical protein
VLVATPSWKLVAPGRPYSSGPAPIWLSLRSARRMVYVTVTGTDSVVGLQMRGASVAQRRAWSTGRQPHSIAFDAHDRLLVVTLTAVDQVELINL